MLTESILKIAMMLQGKQPEKRKQLVIRLIPLPLHSFGADENSGSRYPESSRDGARC
jgi:hypothetical protein